MILGWVSRGTAGTRLHQGRHELLKPSPFIGFDRMDFDPEFLAPRPAHDCLIHKDSGMVIRKKDTERDYRPSFDRMRPINSPSVEREIPGHTAALELIAGIVDRTLDREPTERPHLKPGPNRRPGPRGG